MASALPAKLAPKQRAAALVLALGTGKADTILRHLEPEEIELLADEVARMDSIDPVNRTAAMRVALNYMKSVDPVAEAAALRERARKMATHVDASAPFDPHEPFAFLKKVELHQAVHFLMAEHPQTVAVILANQPPGLAAKILDSFDEDLAGEVALRIATIGRTTPEMLERIERALRRRLTEAADQPESTAPDGAKGLAAILNNANRDMEEVVLGVLSSHDQQLAERVRSLMFVFEDIVTLEDRAVQQILQNVETAALALALKGATEDVKQTVFRNLSERARAALTEEIDLLGAVRKKDVSEARTKIVAQIRALEEAGQIIINRGDDSELIE